MASAGQAVSLSLSVGTLRREDDAKAAVGDNVQRTYPFPTPQPFPAKLEMAKTRMNALASASLSVFVTTTDSVPPQGMSVSRQACKNSSKPQDTLNPDRIRCFFS